MKDEEWIEQWKRSNKINNERFYKFVKSLIIIYLDEKVIEYLK